MTELKAGTLTAADQQLRQALEAGLAPTLLIVGGGITGAAIFAKAAVAGLQPWLLEKGDFASGTSSRSSKMLHGGLRYLASGDIKTVRQSAKQKHWFSKALPEHVSPLPFLYLHKPGEFPYAGIFHQVLNVYDWISGGKKHRRIKSHELPLLMPGFDLSGFKAANLFYDAITDDVALVYSLLLTGIQHGGLCANYIKVENITTADKTQVKVFDLESDTHTQIDCEMLVNASGVWASSLQPLPKGHMRPLRGSHIVLPGWKLPVAASVSIAHPQDKRPVYMYPWQGMTVVGCTDLPETADLDKPVYMHREERDYLLAVVNSLHPPTSVTELDIVSSWAGIRPIISSKPEHATKPSSEPRHHQIWQQSGVVSIAGGKLATAMPMADDILAVISSQLSQKFSVPESITLQSWQQGSGVYELEDVFATGAIKKLEDVFMRRSRLGFTMGVKLKRYKNIIQDHCLSYLDWDGEQFEQQWQAFWRDWQRQYSPAPFSQQGIDNNLTATRIDLNQGLTIPGNIQSAPQHYPSGNQ